MGLQGAVGFSLENLHVGKSKIKSFVEARQYRGGGKDTYLACDQPGFDP